MASNCGFFLDGAVDSLLFKQFPELRAFRDVATWWKFFLNPDLDEFPNYTNLALLRARDGQVRQPSNHRSPRLEWSPAQQRNCR